MNYSARIRVRFFRVCALFLAALPFLWLLFWRGRAADAGASPILSTSIVLLLTILGLIVSVRALLHLRLQGQMKPNRLIRSFAPAKKETEFVAETYQTVVSRLQIDRRQLAERQTAADLRAAAAEQFSLRVISSLPSGLIAVDGAGLIRVINEPANYLINGGEDAAEKHFARVLEPIPELAAMIQNTLETGVLFRRETVLVMPCEPQEPGKPRRLGVTVAPLDDRSAANKIGALCLLTDITEISELREQLALEGNLASLGEMAAGLTHEFKNSLAAIGSYAQFLESIETAGSGKTAARSLHAEVRNLSSIVTAFLDFARPQPLDLNDVDLSILLAECARELEPLFLRLRVELKIGGKFSIIKGDEQMLRRVFLNLMRNAAESFNEDEAAEAPARLVSVNGSRVTDEQRRQWAKIEICDAGGGIASQDLPYLFVPFYTTKTGGHGIGLALSHRIVSEHGGSLSAANSETGGAVFTAAFPLLGDEQS